MILVMLWVPFVIVAMLCGFAAATGLFLENVDTRIRVDRMALLIGFGGPLLVVLVILLYALVSVDRTVRAWIWIDELPKHLREAGAATPADLDRMAAEVKTGTRTCFIPNHVCGICGETVIHSGRHPFLTFFRSLPDERLQTIFDSLTEDEKNALIQVVGEARNHS